MSRLSHLYHLRRAESARRAKKLKREMTDAERKLWYRIRGKRFASWNFRRQVPIGPHVADFLCERARLVVEVDNGASPGRRDLDRARSADLNAQGYEIVRFWNDEVLGNIDGVLEVLERVLKARDSSPAGAFTPP
jgi:very-short-patch-repair endonuclease